MKRRRREGKPVRIRDEIVAVVRRIGEGQRGIHKEIWARWGSIVGSAVAARAFPRQLKSKTLLVAVRSSSWMQELSYIREELIERLSVEIGQGVVTEIRFVLDTADPRHAPPRVPDAPGPPQPVLPSRTLPVELDAALKSVEDGSLRDAIRRAVDANMKR